MKKLLVLVMFASLVALASPVWAAGSVNSVVPSVPAGAYEIITCENASGAFGSSSSQGSWETCPKCGQRYLHPTMHSCVQQQTYPIDK